MARKKSEEVVEETLAPVEASPEATVSRKEAVIRALEAIGPKAEMDRYASFIKENFGIEMPNKVIGIHIYHLRRDRRKKATGESPRRANASTSGGKDVSFEEIRLVRGLLKRHGAARIKDLIELLS
ncbi:MAG: hypothetical protein U0840_15740 [Gemmataceae bacterium]